MSELRFDGRVAIVTGAGNGLGRSHALLLASRGAKVVVNDLGGGRHGDGKSSAAADKVVEEIRAMGGEAVANYDSVENGEAIVKTALDTFGTVDVVINNAGILRDVSFQKMTDADWDLILKVHLTGSKSVSQAAWNVMREKGYGRIIMTTSAAGIYGNFGQANYCAAKLGILGLANCLAEEGRSKGVQVNVIAPIAASRLTETVMPPQLLENLNPEYVSPLVAWLCHEDCKDTKGLFEVGAGYIAKLRWERTLGHTFPIGRAFSMDEVAKRWNKISDFTNAEHPTNTQESLGPILKAISHPSKGGNQFIDLDEGFSKTVELESSYDENDVALYALGVGAARDPLDKTELKFAYELNPDFIALPTFGVMPQSSATLKAGREGKFSLPGMNFGLDRLLHGEQYTELKAPLPRKAKLKHSFKLKAAYDKDPNAVVVFAVSSTDENGNEIIYNEMTAFVKGAGGWGGERGPSEELNVPPDRAPDAVIEEKTDANQTLLYRLSGDWNPLHADPGFARAFGYDRPILHGLCTFGYCGRHVIKAFCANDARYFKSIKVRFAKNVFPGETLITKMWKDGDKVIFETRVKERDEVVIKNAAVELYKEIPKVSAKTQAAAAKPTAAAQSQQIIPDDVFNAIAKYIAQHPDLVAKTGTVFQFSLKNPDNDWTIDLKNGSGSCTPGMTDKADVTLEMDQADMQTVMGGTPADVQKLYFGGKLKITGNIMAANKLGVLQGMDKNAAAAERDARLGGTAKTAAPAAAPAATSTTAPATQKPSTAPALMEKLSNVIRKNAAANAQLCGKVLQVKIRDTDLVWTLDCSGGNPDLQAAPTAKADAGVVLTDSALEALSSGKKNARELYQHGELRADGDVMLAHALDTLFNT